MTDAVVTQRTHRSHFISAPSSSRSTTGLTSPIGENLEMGVGGSEQGYYGDYHPGPACFSVFEEKVYAAQFRKIELP
jgi:hypothetical protein